MNIVSENNEKVSICFNSITDLLSYDPSEIKNPASRSEFEKYVSREKSGGNESYWLGSTNKDCSDVIEHALIGDAELLKSLEPKMTSLDKATGKNANDYKAKIQVVKRKRIMTDEGDEIDMDKVYNGEFETCWSKTKRIELDQEHRLVTLFINIGGTSSVDVEDSFWRSAVAVRITKELEAAGKSVQIIVGSATQGIFNRMNKNMTAHIAVKKYSERLSMERLAAMSHVGFHRTFGFAAKCVTKHDIDTSGLGRSFEVSDRMIPIQVEDEINSGKTKFVYVKACTSESGAINALEHCYSQLKDLQVAA